MSSCSLFYPKAPIENAFLVDKPSLNLPPATPIKVDTPLFYIITENNSTEIWQALQSKKIDKALFGLTDKGYEKLSINLANLIRYIKEQREIIEKYKEYYEPKKDDGDI